VAQKMGMEDLFGAGARSIPRTVDAVYDSSYKKSRIVPFARTVQLSAAMLCNVGVYLHSPRLCSRSYKAAFSRIIRIIYHCVPM
jgi:hypothetical protein